MQHKVSVDVLLYRNIQTDKNIYLLYLVLRVHRRIKKDWCICCLFGWKCEGHFELRPIVHLNDKMSLPQHTDRAETLNFARINENLFMNIIKICIYSVLWCLWGSRVAVWRKTHCKQQQKIIMWTDSASWHLGLVLDRRRNWNNTRLT